MTIQQLLAECERLRELARPLWENRRTHIDATLISYQIYRLRDQALALISQLPEGEERNQLAFQAKRF